LRSDATATDFDLAERSRVALTRFVSQRSLVWAACIIGISPSARADLDQRRKHMRRIAYVHIPHGNNPEK